MEKKNIIITGCSTGVGLQSAVMFAKHGYKVYATMRNTKKSGALQTIITQENLNIEILELDVTKTETINHVVEYVISKDQKIDILLNNAGAGFAKTTEQATEEEFINITEINYHGTVRCTKAVLPHMRAQKSGRILSVTSVGGLVGQPFNEFYCAAKFAVEGYIEALATYTEEPFNIKYSLIEPGGISTEFMNSAVHLTKNEEGKLSSGEYEPLFNSYMASSQKRAQKSELQVYQTPQEVAEIILSVAEQDDPPLRKRTSAWAEELCDIKTSTDPDGKKLQTKVRKEFLSNS